MNKYEAYTACHEIMLTIDDYIPREGAHITYIVTQIADLPDSVNIASSVINPAMPEKGDIKTFLESPLDQKIAIIGVTSTSKLLQRIHQQLQKAMSMNTSDEETVRLLQKLLFLNIKETKK